MQILLPLFFLHAYLLATIVITPTEAFPVEPSDATLSNRFDINYTNPEALAFFANGPLPANMTKELKYGLAEEVSVLPSTVSASLRKPSVAGVATAPQVTTLAYYTSLSANSYCRSVVPFGEWDCPHCDETPDVKLVESFATLFTDTNAYFARSDTQKKIFIVFRGTNSIRNAITDTVFLPVDYPPVKGGQVHKGFLDSLNEIRNNLFATTTKQTKKYPGYQIELAGHSFGGAIAHLWALELFQQGYDADRLALYTFGEPRVGNSIFAKYTFDTAIPYKRVIHERDIVPHIPPASFNFLHAGEENWIISDGSVRICPNGIETKLCSNSIVPFTSIIDHLSYFGIMTGLCIA